MTMVGDLLVLWQWLWVKGLGILGTWSRVLEHLFGLGQLRNWKCDIVDINCNSSSSHTTAYTVLYINVYLPPEPKDIGVTKQAEDEADVQPRCDHGSSGH